MLAQNRSCLAQGSGGSDKANKVGVMRDQGPILSSALLRGSSIVTDPHLPCRGLGIRVGLTENRSIVTAINEPYSQGV